MRCCSNSIVSCKTLPGSRASSRQPANRWVRPSSVSRALTRTKPPSALASGTSKRATTGCANPSALEGHLGYTVCSRAMRHFLRSLRNKALAPTLEAIEDLRRDLRRDPTADYPQTETLSSLLAVLRPRAPFPPFRGWAISPDFAVLLLTQVLTRRPARVVELGSGVSTLVLGYALE